MHLALIRYMYLSNPHHRLIFTSIFLPCSLFYTIDTYSVHIHLESGVSVSHQLAERQTKERNKMSPRNAYTENIEMDTYGYIRLPEGTILSSTL